MTDRAEQFGDALAGQTDWRPLVKGGSSFRTHRLVQVRPDRVAFVPTFEIKVFALILVALGVGAGVGIPIAISRLPTAHAAKMILPILIGASFVAAGVFMWAFAIKPRVFDKSARYFWKGRKSPEATFADETSANWVALEDIHALQIIAERIRTGKNFYHSYELNLVRHDGRRMHVVDHSDRARMLADAQTLSEFLDVPIWNTGDALD